MAQIFSRTADTRFRAIVIAILGIAIGSLVVAGAYARSQYAQDVARTPLQPVPFSHEHHAGELGIDCRYCHTTVETSAEAGMPTTVLRGRAVGIGVAFHSALPCAHGRH